MNLDTCGLDFYGVLFALWWNFWCCYQQSNSHWNTQNTANHTKTAGVVSRATCIESLLGLVVQWVQLICGGWPCGGVGFS